MQVNDLFKQTIVPMTLAKVKLLEGSMLSVLEQELNSWIVETKSVLLSVPLIAKTDQTYLVSVTYMEATDARS